MPDTLRATIIFEDEKMYKDFMRFIYLQKLMGNLIPDIRPADLVCLAVIKSVEMGGETVVIESKKKE